MFDGHHVVGAPYVFKMYYEMNQVAGSGAITTFTNYPRNINKDDLIALWKRKVLEHISIDKLQQKIISQTKLIRTNNDDAHYQIYATITNYDPSQTVGVSGQQASTNRLTVTVHVLLKKTLDNKEQEFDVSRNFDFSANLTLNQAEGQLMDDILRNITDDIFNQIFSNW